jgi:hypothetical protein
MTRGIIHKTCANIIATTTAMACSVTATTTKLAIGTTLQRTMTPTTQDVCLPAAPLPCHTCKAIACNSIALLSVRTDTCVGTVYTAQTAVVVLPDRSRGTARAGERPIAFFVCDSVPYTQNSVDACVYTK